MWTNSSLCSGSLNYQYRSLYCILESSAIEERHTRTASLVRFSFLNQRNRLLLVGFGPLWPTEMNSVGFESFHLPHRMTECVEEVLAERTLFTLRGSGTNFGDDWSVRLQRPNWPLRFRPTDHNRPRISIMSIWFFEIDTSEIAQPTLIDVESRVVAWSFPIVVLRRVRFEKKFVISSSLSYGRFIKFKFHWMRSRLYLPTRLQ